MSAPTLTTGAIEAISREKTPENPVFQVLSIKKIASQVADPSKPDRYRLCLSDGVHKQPSAMLATQLNDLVTDNKITAQGIIRLDRYICNTVSDRRIIIVLGATVLHGSVGHEIGAPKKIEAADPNKVDTPTATAAPMSSTTTAPTTTVDTKPVVSHNNNNNNTNTNSTNSGASAANTALKSNPYGNRKVPAPRTSGSGGQGNILPIEALNPYQNRWTIKGRVTSRSDRTYRSDAQPDGQGKLMNVEILDDSGEIRCTAFNQDVDRLGHLLEVGKVYTIRGGRLKPANKRFNQTNNAYEITFGHETEVVEVMDTTDMPAIRYDYVDFTQLEKMNKDNAFVDVLAVIHTVDDLTTIMTKRDSRELSKREITLMDQAQIAVKCTIWGKNAEEWSHQVGDVIAIKKAKLSDFGGCSMSLSGASSFEINPDRPEVHELRGWYESEGKNATLSRVSNSGTGGRVDRRIVVSQVKDDNLGANEDKPDYFVVKGAVSFIRKSPTACYKACPSEGCNKKLIEEGDEWRCEKCQKAHKDFKYRIMLSLSALDPTAQLWVTCFSETAEVILGQTAKKMGELQDAGDEATIDKIHRDAYFKQYMFKCRAKSDTYQGETRVKCSVVGVTPVDYVSESKYLIDKIKQYA